MPLYRFHPHDRKPWWFSSDLSGRFDLPAPRGTCHLALQPIGAFLETFREIALIARSDVETRRISALQVPREMVLVDCTHPRAAGFGVTAARHAGEDYTRTQEWAAAIAGAGFEGVHYLLSHDPSQRCQGVALFGETGLQDWPAETPQPISDDLISEAWRRFGLLVLPAPC